MTNSTKLIEPKFLFIFLAQRLTIHKTKYLKPNVSHETFGFSISHHQLNTN
ncbi:hypothetical protein AO367_1013 [Moraxella catarrhalis]|uniref:Uncharacterized protein n=1 Tax=Moraxella catarrhalis TaxID=480 RepID=A0AB36DQJ7_MORCA|nr:hypothetical protein AO381_1189 [Moraxella catarrhalis]OAV04861.1 hypothetical protein AO379_1945 [Moraxella catarrhalis]OAV13769.1 hypothetical protein AO380_0122 [Moraxella catarrhalis]OAV27007.1 hypothetical protein AO370_0348 [Moraxella catarrhalis]OAV30789.1 hypothetical protein AO367_1013 [Moraxella catarrhalis]